jgi:hypothetical protein
MEIIAKDVRDRAGRNNFCRKLQCESTLWRAFEKPPQKKKTTEIYNYLAQAVHAWLS